MNSDLVLKENCDNDPDKQSSLVLDKKDGTDRSGKLAKTARFLSSYFSHLFWLVQMSLKNLQK